jgi:hypothetical protein
MAVKEKVKVVAGGHIKHAASIFVAGSDFV